MKCRIVVGLVALNLSLLALSACEPVAGPGGGDQFGGGTGGGDGDVGAAGSITSILVNGRAVFPALPGRDDHFVDALLSPSESEANVTIEYSGTICVTFDGAPITSGETVPVPMVPADKTINVTAGFETWAHKLTGHLTSSSWRSCSRLQAIPGFPRTMAAS